MSDYLIRFENKETHERTRIYIENVPDHISSAKIKELALYSLNSKEQNSHCLRVVWQEDKIITSNIIDSNLKATIEKIGEPETFKPISKSLSEIYSRITNKTHDFSFKFLWNIFIAPFIAIHRFIHQDVKLKAKIHKRFDNTLPTQQVYLRHLDRAQKILEKANNGKSDKLIELLDKAIEFGKKIEDISKPNHHHPNLSEEITNFIYEKAVSSSPSILAFIPLTIEDKGGSLPLGLIFVKKGTNLYLEIEGLPQGSPLATSYQIGSISHSETEGKLEHIVNAFIKVPTKNDLLKANSPIVNLSYREKIKTKNADAMMFRHEINEKKQVIKNAPDWIHEVVCNFAIPIKEDKEDIKNSQHKDPILTLFKSLQTKHSLSHLDKAAWIKLSFLESYHSYKSVEHKLNNEDKIYFFDRLYDEAEKLKNSHPELKPLIETLSKDKLSINEIQRQLQGKKLTKKITSSSRPTLKIDADTYKIKQDKEDLLTTHSKLTVKPSLDPSETVLINNIKLESNNYQINNGALILLTNRLDDLIEKQEYAKAKEIGLQALEKLKVTDSVATDSAVVFSDNLGLIVKCIWECSLRLNISCCSPREIVQLMKAQVLNQKFTTDYQVFDDEEFINQIDIHPHMRFGWKSKELEEIKEIKKEIPKVISQIRKREGNDLPRWDTTIKTRLLGDAIGNSPYKLEDPIFSPHTSCRYHQAQNDPIFINSVRMQIMTTSMLKPDYTLSLFYGTGVKEQANGLNWLKNLNDRAIALGSKTKAEIFEAAKTLKLKDVQNQLASAKRLEIGFSTFVTEKECFTILDKTTKQPILAYLPNGFGMPAEYESKNNLLSDEKNTAMLAGGGYGQGQFIGLVTDKKINHRGLQDSLSPQKTYTESALYFNKLQTAPKGQINQVDDFLLSRLQIYNFNTKSLNPGSVIEALNLIKQGIHLNNPDFQKTLLLLLARTDLLENAFDSYSFELEVFVKDLNEILATIDIDQDTFCFLVQIKQILSLKPLKQNSKTLGLFDVKQDMVEIEKFLGDPKNNRLAASITYMYNLYFEGLNKIQEDQIPLAFFSLQQFLKLADNTQPQIINAEIKEWIIEQLLPHLNQLLSTVQEEKVHAILDNIIDLFTDTSLQGKSIDWIIHKKNPLKASNNKYDFDLSSLEITDKNSGQKLTNIPTLIPPHVQKNNIFLELFGKSPLYATVRSGPEEGVFLYDFSIGTDTDKKSYSIEYNNFTGKIKPKWLKDGKWYCFDKSIDNPGNSAIEQLIKSNGIWIDEKDCKNGFFKTSLFGNPPKELEINLLFSNEGLLTSITNLNGSLNIAVLSKEKIKQLFPFSNPSETIVMTDSSGSVKEVYFLQNGSHAYFENGKWVYNNPHTGISEWLVDLKLNKKISIDDSHENKFLSSFASDHEQFIVPTMQDNKKEFLIFPYRITPHSKSQLQFEKEQSCLMKNDAPLKLSFKEDGQLIGSPSTFLYLCYYFIQKKDLSKAAFYLKKMQEVSSNNPESEAVVFRRILQLFTEIPYSSNKNVVFQLEAIVVAQNILKNALDDSTPSSFEMVLFIAKKYTSLNEDIKQKLPFNIKTELDKILKSSLIEFIPIEPASKNKITYVTPSKNLFSNTLVDPSIKNNFKKYIDPQLILMSNLDFDPDKTINELTNIKSLSTDFFLKNFFKYFLSIVEACNHIPYNTKSLNSLLSLLLTQAEWHNHTFVNENDRFYAIKAENLRQYLVFKIVSILKQGDNHERFDNIEKVTDDILRVLRLIQEQLPYFDRSTPILSYIFAIHDTASYKVPNIQFLISLIIDAIDIPIEEIKDVSVIGESLFNFQPRVEKTKEENGITLENIEATLNSKTPSLHLSPIEQQELQKTLESEKASGSSFKKKRSLSTYVDEAAMEGIPMDQIRTTIEEMSLIDEIEKSLIKDTTSHLELPYIQSNFISTIQYELTEKVKTFSEISESDLASIQTKKANIQNNYETSLKYISVKDSDDLAIKEEFEQLQNGFTIAKTVLEDEVNSKNDFSPDEIKNMKSFLKQESKVIDDKLKQQKEILIAQLESNKDKLPSEVQDILNQKELYTTLDLIEKIQTYFKDPKHTELRDLDTLTFEILHLQILLQEFTKAQNKVENNLYKEALILIKQAIQLDRYDNENPILARKYLVGEAKANIIYRKGQKDIIKKAFENPKQWSSLRMGLGKTSYGIPTIVQALVDKGNSTVVTVPEVLLNSNRVSFDKATKQMFDQAGLLFKLPLIEDIPLHHLSNIVLKILNAYKNKQYIVTSVEELATLQDTILLLQDKRSKLIKEREQINPEELNNFDRNFVLLEFRLQYYKKIDNLLNGIINGQQCNHVFFGDETDATHSITNEVSIAIGEKGSPPVEIQQVSKIILQTLLHSKDDPLKNALINNDYTTLAPGVIEKSLDTLSLELIKEGGLLFSFIKDPHLKNTLETLAAKAPKDWIAFIRGKTDLLPPGLSYQDISEYKMIAAIKQIMTTTFSGILLQKAGNDLGYSDVDGFVVVPKITKNDIPGMRFSDPYQMVFAQYFAMLEFKFAESSTDKSLKFLTQSIESFKSKSPSNYEKLANDYNRYKAKFAEDSLPSMMDYLILPEAYEHRWNILEEIIFQGYIQQFNEQVETNVQEIFHRKNAGGVTGTLDPYSLPLISEEVTLGIQNNDEISSTREVEAETFLRLSLNHEKGLDTICPTYEQKKAAKAIDKLLKDPETKAIINSSGDSSEGFDTLTWIDELRKNKHGQNRSYLFMHPKYRIPYLYTNGKNSEPIVYTNQKLPDNCVCIYAPSDVRGVDLPIPKGNVHMLVSSTASQQELVQSIYRARQLGFNHKLIFNISTALEATIKEQMNKTKASFGDVLVYLIKRAAPQKQELNLTAQLSKIQLDLKTLVSSFLKETNPHVGSKDMLTNDGIKTIYKEAVAESLIFDAVRSLYIKKKDVDYEAAFAPRESIDSTKKILNAFDNLQNTIDDYLIAMEEPLLSNLVILNKMDNETDQGCIDRLLKELLEKFNGLENLSVISNLTNLIANPNLSNLPEIYAQMKAEIKKMDDTNPNKEKLIKINQWIDAKFFGPKRSNIYHSLLELKENLKLRKDEFEKNIELHQKFLPLKTTKNSIGSNANEQVKEMQQQQTLEIEDTLIPEDSNIILSAKGSEKFYETPIADILNPKHSRQGLKTVYDSKPFDNIYMSLDAKKFIDDLQLMPGAPLFYVVLNKNNQAVLISSQDLWTNLRDSARDSQNPIKIMMLTPSGASFITGSDDASTVLSKGETNLILTIKAYLGYTEEFKENKDGYLNKEVSDWIKSLTSDEKKEILQHVNTKGSSVQRAVFNKLL